VESSASAILEYTNKLFDLQKVMRSAVINAHKLSEKFLVRSPYERLHAYPAKLRG